MDLRDVILLCNTAILALATLALLWLVLEIRRSRRHAGRTRAQAKAPAQAGAQAPGSRVHPSRCPPRR